MRSTTTITALSLLTTLTSAHFTLQYPTVRGFDEDNLVQFPCGGFNTPSTTRTPWPITNGSIALEMGHLATNVEVLLGLGNNPGSAFNTILRPTFLLTCYGAFCMTGFTIPEGLNITEGTNATIQVQSNGDPDGGLYNCADITFVNEMVLEGGKCTNATFELATATTGGHANGTKYGEVADQASPSPTESGAVASGSQSAPATTSTPGAAAGLSAGIGGVILAGAAALAIVL